MTTGPSGFIWLRFICAAIISPKLFGLIDANETISTEKSRDLVLIAKVLQNLGACSRLFFLIYLLFSKALFYFRSNRQRIFENLEQKKALW